MSFVLEVDDLFSNYFLMVLENFSMDTTTVTVTDSVTVSVLDSVLDSDNFFFLKADSDKTI